MVSNPTTPRINATQDATTASRRHKSYLQWCCPGKVCEKDFHGVTDRLEVIKFRPLFEAFIHYNKEGEVMSSMPYSKKFSEYLFDFADYNTSWRMEEKFVTTKEVLALGRDKISLYWWLLDKYSARYDRNGYTWNLVDVVVIIPECNIIAEEHFYFRYMSRRQGNRLLFCLNCYDKLWLVCTTDSMCSRESSSSHSRSHSVAVLKNVITRTAKRSRRLCWPWFQSGSTQGFIQTTPVHWG